MNPLSALVGPGPDHSVTDNHLLAQMVLDAAQRFAEATRDMGFASWAAQETALALKEADAAAHDVHNDLLQTRIREQQDGGGSHEMGFMATPDPDHSEGMSAAGIAAEESKLAYGRAEATAKLAEVSAERAAWELDQAQNHLLDVARSVPAATTDESTDPGDTV
jgi:hypothetical protein